MNIKNIPFQDTGFFSRIMCDYIALEPGLKPFYNRFPSIHNFRNQIDEKRVSIEVSSSQRQRLVSVLKEQYRNIETSELTKTNIQALLKSNTFTITTGHQLNLFTGPLYFLYKIISTINLCERLSLQFPEENFVPVYWMATEDHDFEEINYFNFEGKKVQWNSVQTGGVGRFKTDGLDDVLEEFSKHMGTSKNARYLKDLFQEAYLKHNSLAEATRYIANKLFEADGLVVIDADDKTLKKEFIPYMEYELLHQTSYNEVKKTVSKLEEESYGIQVNPREINLFYLTDNLRERIIFENESYGVMNTSIRWTKKDILNEVQQHPERFSPNVIMRPLYQEVILPNLCYIGGGGELAYWMQLKDYFDKVNVTFPILLLRNSVQVITKKNERKLEKLNVSHKELFMNQHELITKKTLENSEIAVDFFEQKQVLKEQFDMLRQVANQTDKSFIGAVNAQEKKQIKGLDTLEKRLLRAEKRKHADLVDRIVLLQNTILPNQSLEERQRNFSEYYLEYGDMFIDVLKDNLKPLQLQFTVLTL